MSLYNSYHLLKHCFCIKLQNVFKDNAKIKWGLLQNYYFYFFSNLTLLLYRIQSIWLWQLPVTFGKLWFLVIDYRCCWTFIFYGGMVSLELNLYFLWYKFILLVVNIDFSDHYANKYIINNSLQLNNVFEGLSKMAS